MFSLPLLPLGDQPLAERLGGKNKHLFALRSYSKILYPRAKWLALENSSNPVREVVFGPHRNTENTSRGPFHREKQPQLLRCVIYAKIGHVVTLPL